MAKNKLDDALDFLYSSLADMDNEELSGEELKNAAQKAQVKIGITKQIVDINKLKYDGAKLTLDAVQKGIVPRESVFANEVLLLNKN